MTGMYPGIGTPMYRANDSTPTEPVWAGMRNPTEVIANGKYSIPIPVNPGLATDINVVFDSAPTTNAFEVRYMPTIDNIADEYVLETVAATTDTAYTWTTNSQLSGLIRIKNVGTASIENAWLQSRAATNT